MYVSVTLAETDWQLFIWKGVFLISVEDKSQKSIKEMISGANAKKK